MNNVNINLLLDKLSKSNFRNKFHLSVKDINYIKDKGLNKIEQHAFSFISSRLSPANILNDGKQTPFKGHPVFIAQHACACCCRECLYKWHKIPKNRSLNLNEQNFIVKLLLAWIAKEYKSFSKNNVL